MEIRPDYIKCNIILHNRGYSVRSYQVHFGVYYGSSVVIFRPLELTFELFWNHFEVILGDFRCHLELILGSLQGYSGDYSDCF